MSESVPTITGEEQEDGKCGNSDGMMTDTTDRQIPASEPDERTAPESDHGDSEHMADVKVSSIDGEQLNDEQKESPLKNETEDEDHHHKADNVSAPTVCAHINTGNDQEVTKETDLSRQEENTQITLVQDESLQENNTPDTYHQQLMEKTNNSDDRDVTTTDYVTSPVICQSGEEDLKRSEPTVSTNVVTDKAIPPSQCVDETPKQTSEKNESDFIEPMVCTNVDTDNAVPSSLDHQSIDETPQHVSEKQESDFSEPMICANVGTGSGQEVMAIDSVTSPVISQPGEGGQKCSSELSVGFSSEPMVCTDVDTDKAVPPSASHQSVDETPELGSEKHEPMICASVDTGSGQEVVPDSLTTQIKEESSSSSDSDSSDSDSDSTSSDDEMSKTSESSDSSVAESGAGKNKRNGKVAVDSDDSDDFEDDHCSTRSSQPPPPLRTATEKLIEELPQIEELDIKLPEELKMCELGSVTSIIGQLVVIQGTPGSPALDIETTLFSEKREFFGKIFEVFGPVLSPLYAVRFNSPNHIKSKGVQLQDKVFYANQCSEYTSYVFLAQLRQMKGSDASWKNDEEPPEEFLDYSDDEAERRAKSKKSQGKDKRKRKTNANRRDGDRGQPGNSGGSRENTEREHNQHHFQHHHHNIAGHRGRGWRVNRPPGPRFQGHGEWQGHPRPPNVWGANPGPFSGLDWAPRNNPGFYNPNPAGFGIPNSSPRPPTQQRFPHGILPNPQFPPMMNHPPSGLLPPPPPPQMPPHLSGFSCPPFPPPPPVRFQGPHNMPPF